MEEQHTAKQTIDTVTDLPCRAGCASASSFTDPASTYPPTCAHRPQGWARGPAAPLGHGAVGAPGGREALGGGRTKQAKRQRSKTEGMTKSYTHLSSLAEDRDVHPPWSWKHQRPIQVGSPKVIIRLKVRQQTQAQTYAISCYIYYTN